MVCGKFRDFENKICANPRYEVSVSSAFKKMDKKNTRIIFMGTPDFAKIPEVTECHFTTGPYTLLIKLYARDNEHLMDLLNNHIQEIPGVVATETMISLSQGVKREVPIKVGTEEVE